MPAVIFFVCLDFEKVAILGQPPIRSLNNVEQEINMGTSAQSQAGKKSKGIFWLTGMWCIDSFFSRPLLHLLQYGKAGPLGQPEAIGAAVAQGEYPWMR